MKCFMCECIHKLESNETKYRVQASAI